MNSIYIISKISLNFTAYEMAPNFGNQSSTGPKVL
jgi:hypothetical protein